MSGGVKTVWFGPGVGPAVARTALWPAAVAFRGGVWARNALYNAGLLQILDTGLPVISVGNLTVGGTGKTPVSAWIASELKRKGARPAIVMRGYGDDEPAVHARLNPDIPVIVAPDRVAGVMQVREGGANVVVLDDAFQHRRVARQADIVLVSAERGLATARMLPAGPFREPVGALRRASMVLVTRKTAARSEAEAVLGLAIGVSGIPGGIVRLELNEIVPADGGAPLPVASLEGKRVTLLTGVAEPELVAAQVRAYGARVTVRAYPDHHAFSDADLAAAARDGDAMDFSLCTLKDVVKIAGRWPGERPLWYLSQRLIVERGDDELMRLLDGILATITLNPQTSG